MDHFNSLGNNCLPDQGEKQKEFLKIGGEYLVILLINKLILEEIKLRYHLKLWDHLHAVKPRLCRTWLPRIHCGGTKTATVAKTKQPKAAVN